MNEQEIFVRGEKLELFDTNKGRIGVMICHDGTYPELPRTLVLMGADLICWLMNNGNCISWARHYAHWYMVPIAIANKANIGGSAIVDGDGKSIVEAPSAHSIELVAELDPAKWRESRAEGTGGQAVYRVRRPDLYGALIQRYSQAKPITTIDRGYNNI